MLSAMSEQAGRKRAELGEIPTRKVKQTMYLVKWAGLGYEFCTWETKEDIGSSEFIAEFRELNDAVPEEEDDDDDIGVQLDGQQIVPSNSQIDAVQVPLSDQAAVDEEAKEWASLWKESAEYLLSMITRSSTSLLPFRR